MKRLAILGSTGSIGTSTLDVVARHPDRFKVAALAAGGNADRLTEQIRTHAPDYVSIGSAEDAARLRKLFPKVAIGEGEEGLCEAAAYGPADLVVSCTTGRSGLKPTLRAVEAGKNVALANKESLVMAGKILMDLAKKRKTLIVPVDSEHNGVFRLLSRRGAAAGHKVGAIILTASGGPFLDYPLEKFREITPAEALNHPTWSMGPKITVDSATLANKGLEVIEARWLFECPGSRIKVLIHPQSIVHSIVELADGSWLAHMARADMRIPILHALCFPEDTLPLLPSLTPGEISRLEFREPDMNRFPALRLAYEALEEGGTLPAVYNSANEAANEFFRKGKIRFDAITAVIETVMAAQPGRAANGIEDVLEADRWAREEALRLMNSARTVYNVKDTTGAGPVRGAAGDSK